MGEVDREIINVLGSKEVIVANLPRPLLKSLFKLRADLYNLSFDRGDGGHSRSPAVMQFNVSSICNADCSFCAYKYVRSRETMDFAVFEKGLAEFVSLGGDYIGLNPLVGEPLLDRNLGEKLNLCASFPALKRIEMFTNGILLRKQEKAELIINSPITHLFISMGPFDRENYERTMGVNKYADAKNGIINIINCIKQTQSKIYIRLMMRGSIDSIMTEDFKKEILPLVGPDFVRNNIQFIELYDSWGGQIKKDDLPSGADLLPNGYVRIRPCARMLNMAILPNGDMRLCDCRIGTKGAQDELIVGNVLKDSVAEVWKSEKVKRLRRSFSDYREPEVCKRCNFYSPA